MASAGSSPRLDALTNYSGWCSLSAVTGVVNFDEASLGAFSMCGGVKQGCVLPPILVASSLPSCWNIPSMHLWRVFSSIQDQMESYSICPDWGPRPKYTKQSSGTCSLLMMWPWLPALDSSCRSLWTNSHKPVKTLAWLSALKKPTCWAVASNTPWGYWPNFLWSKEGFFSSGVGTACLALLNQKRESRPQRGFEPWLLQCQCRALPILSYQSNWKLGVMWVNNEIVDDWYRCRL